MSTGPTAPSDRDQASAPVAAAREGYAELMKALDPDSGASATFVQQQTQDVIGYGLLGRVEGIRAFEDMATFCVDWLGAIWPRALDEWTLADVSPSPTTIRRNTNVAFALVYTHPTGAVLAATVVWPWGPSHHREARCFADEVDMLRSRIATGGLHAAAEPLTLLTEHPGLRKFPDVRHAEIMCLDALRASPVLMTATVRATLALSNQDAHLPRPPSDRTTPWVPGSGDPFPWSQV